MHGRRNYVASAVPLALGMDCFPIMVRPSHLKDFRLLHPKLVGDETGWQGTYLKARARVEHTHMALSRCRISIHIPPHVFALLLLVPSLRLCLVPRGWGPLWLACRRQLPGFSSGRSFKQGATVGEAEELERSPVLYEDLAHHIIYITVSCLFR
jgi:hypothetical protein